MNPLMFPKPEPYEIDQNQAISTPELQLAQSNLDKEKPGCIGAACGLPNIEPRKESTHNFTSVDNTIDTELRDNEPPVDSMPEPGEGLEFKQDSYNGWGPIRPTVQTKPIPRSEWDWESQIGSAPSPNPYVKVDKEEEEKNVYISPYKLSKFGDSKGLPMVRVENPDDTPTITPLSWVPTHRSWASSEQDLCSPKAESLLLKLSPRLRMQIFQYCVPTATLSLAHTRRRYILDTNRQTLSRLREDAKTTIAWTALFTVSWTIHREYTEVFYDQAQLRLVFPEDYELVQCVEDWAHDLGFFRPSWAPALKIPDFRNLTLKVRVDMKRKEESTLAFEFLNEVMIVRTDISIRRVTVDLSEYDPKKVVKKEAKWLWRVTAKRDGYHEAWDRVADMVAAMIGCDDLEVWLQFWKSECEDRLPPTVQPTIIGFIAKCGDDNIDVKAW